MKKAPTLFLVLFATYLSLPVTTRANDSTISLAAGGIKMEKTDKIRINQERLVVSQKEITVDYEMENITDEVFETLVAFPMPAQNAAELVNVPVLPKDRNSDNFVEFHVTVDGKEIKTEKDIHAYYIEEDHSEVTAVLEKAGLLILPIKESFYETLEKLPLATQNELEKAKLLMIERYDPEHLTYTPTWETKMSYFWKQRFEPHKVVHIHHRYSPVVGVGYFGKYSFDEERIKWCIDGGTEKAITKLLQRQKKSEDAENSYLRRAQVDYVLSTGANWAGPISDFTLTIAKEQPNEIVSTCLSGLQKTSPLNFTYNAKDFKPKSDLSVIFIRPTQ